MATLLWGLAFGPAATAFLDDMHPGKIRAQIVKKAKALQLAPFPNGAIQLKGVTTGMGEPVMRVRSGDYRILYVVRENPGEVLILDIDHRKDVYR